MHFCTFTKMMAMRLIISALAFTALAACSKDDNNNNNSTPDNAAVITFTTPNAGITYLNGDNLRVQGEINDADVVKTARVQIKNKSTNAVYYEQTISVGNLLTYPFLWNWTVTGISAPQTATVTVTSTDTKGNNTSKSVDINLLP